MAAGTSTSLWITLLSVVLSVSVSVSVSAGQEPIRAEPGENVSLPCKALNNHPVIAVEWRRTDLKGDEYVLLYRDKKSDPAHQHPSYKNRVDLQDRQMKDGDVSLILIDVKIDDNGTYECHVFQRKPNHRKRSISDSDPTSTIRLDVVPAGNTGGHQEDGGDQPGHHRGYPGLIAGAVVLVVAVSLITLRHMKKKSSPPSSSSSSSSSSSPPSSPLSLQSSDHLLA